MAKTATWRNTPFAHKFYHSKEWRGTLGKDGKYHGGMRNFIMDRAHGLCERCVERARKGEVPPDRELTPADVVHHITPLSPENMDDPSVTLDPANLMALCHDCHTEVHQHLGVGAMNGRRREEPRVGFDEDGNVVRI